MGGHGNEKEKTIAKKRAAITKSILRLPDLEVAKTAVIKYPFLPRCSARLSHAIDEFVEWYCSEPRLSFSKTVALRYRMHLESRHLAPGTINFVSAPCVASHMKLQTVVFSAQIWQQE